MSDLGLPYTGAQLAATIATALLAGLARGFSGFGSALIFVPIASAVVGPRVAVPLLMLVENFTAFPLIPSAWRLSQRGQVMVVSAGALAGLPVGVWLLVTLDPVPLRWAMCVLVGAAAVLLASGWHFSGRPTLRLSLAVGATSGLFAGAAEMGGPPIVAYWLGSDAPAARVRANLVLFLAITGAMAVVVFLVGGLLSRDVLLLTAVVAPAFGGGLWVGSRLFGLASEQTFRRICLALIALAAIIGMPLWH